MLHILAPLLLHPSYTYHTASIFLVASKLHIQYCQHFPCCIQVTHTILPAFSLLHPNYTYNTASIVPVASRLHIPYCQHFPCCVQITHTILPVFSLLHQGYTYHTASIFPVASKLHIPAFVPSASKLHMPAFSLLHPSYTCQHFSCCIQVTHTRTFPVMSQSNSHNQRFFNNIHSDS